MRPLWKLVTDVVTSPSQDTHTVQHSLPHTHLTHSHQPASRSIEYHIFNAPLQPHETLINSAVMFYEEAYLTKHWRRCLILPWWSPSALGSVRHVSKGQIERGDQRVTGTNRPGENSVKNRVWLLLQQTSISWFHTHWRIDGCTFSSGELPFLIVCLCFSAACSCPTSPYVIWRNATDGPSRSRSWHEFAMFLRPWFWETEQMKAGSGIKYTTVK